MENLSFRPLWGSYLSQSEGRTIYEQVQAVSVPYGDHICLNADDDKPYRKVRKSFRPLWGSYLSQ